MLTIAAGSRCPAASVTGRHHFAACVIGGADRFCWRPARLALPFRGNFDSLAEGGGPVYAVSWQVESSILTLRRATARETLHIAELQIAGDRQKILIADATGETISLFELRKRAEAEANEPAKEGRDEARKPSRD
jgi:hypothetical protein